MKICAQPDAREYLSKVKLMITESYPELASVVLSDDVQSALEEKRSIEVVTLRVLGALSRKVWAIYGEELQKKDNSCTRALGHPAFDVLRLLARSGSEYVKVNYPVISIFEPPKLVEESRGLRLLIPEHMYVLTFSPPFSDYLGSRVMRNSDLG